MKLLALFLFLALALHGADAQYTIKNGVVIYLSTAADVNAPTRAESDALFALISSEKAAATTAEAVRLTKRPKRSQINAAKAATASAQTVPELRAAVVELMVLLDNVLSYQRVDVDEDE